MPFNIVCDGSKTLSKICEVYNADIQVILRLNDSIKNSLIEQNLRGQKVPDGTVLVMTDSSGYDLSRVYSTDYKLDNQGLVSSVMQAKTSRQVNSQGVRSIGNDHTADLSHFSIYHGGQITSSYGIPVYPGEVSDTSNVQFSQVSLLGRSVDYQIYNGSGRTLSFSMILHEEMFNDYHRLGEIVAALESANYPNYQNDNVLPPEILFVIGGSVDGTSGFKRIRGILDSFTPNWKAPIIDGRLVVCEMSLSIKETTGPYSGSEVRSMKGIRGK